MKKFGMAFLVMILGLFMVNGLHAQRRGPAPKPQPAQEESVDADEAYLFEGYDIFDEEYIVLEDYIGEKVIIVNFWATWCGPCRYEIPDLIDLQEDYEDELIIIGLSFDGAASTVKTFYNNNDMNYPVLMATDEMDSEYGGVSAIPTTFIIDLDGNISETIVGSRTYENFETAILDAME